MIRGNMIAGEEGRSLMVLAAPKSIAAVVKRAGVPAPHVREIDRHRMTAIADRKPSYYAC